jgi:hypothetical protein
MVASTISRASYGIGFGAPFDPSIHLEEDKKWNIHEGVWWAINQMRWYLKRVGIALIPSPLPTSLFLKVLRLNLRHIETDS